MGAEDLQAQKALSWVAPQGNALIYSANSNVPLTLFVDQPANGNALHGNIIIHASRGTDSVNPSQVPVPGDGMVQVMLHVGGAGTADVMATLATYAAGLSVEVAVADASKTTLAFEPNTIVAGEQSALATLWARDSLGRSIAGVMATVTTQNPNTRILPEDVVTSARGKAVFTVLGHHAGPHELAIASEHINLSQTVTVVPAGINGLASTLMFTPATQAPGGSVSVELLAQDAFGNSVEGLLVRLIPSSPDCTLGATTGVTDNSGRLATSMSCATAKLVSVIAQMRRANTSSLEIRNSVLFVAPTP